MAHAFSPAEMAQSASRAAARALKDFGRDMAACADGFQRSLRGLRDLRPASCIGRRSLRHVRRHSVGVGLGLLLES